MICGPKLTPQKSIAPVHKRARYLHAVYKKLLRAKIAVQYGWQLICLVIREEHIGIHMTTVYVSVQCTYNTYKCAHVGVCMYVHTYVTVLHMFGSAIDFELTKITPQLVRQRPLRRLPVGSQILVLYVCTQNSTYMIQGSIFI